MDRFERIYQLDRLLRQARYPIPPTALCERLACSRATLYRSIADLRDGLGAPIRHAREQGGLYYARDEDGHFELPGLWFNAAELHALLCIQQLLAALGPGLLEREIQPLRERIEAMLSHERLAVGDLSRRVQLHPLASRAVSGAVFRHCASAVLQRRRLRLTYHGRVRDAASRRTVSPQRLLHYRDNWYLDAWCHRSRGLRRFALDRIRAAEPLNQPARELDADQLERHYAAGYGVFGGPARYTAVLHFSPDAARWVADEQWHAAQQGRFLDDGRYELRLPYGEPTELIMDILRYGPAVEVVAPDELRHSVVEQLRRAADRYRD